MKFIIILISLVVIGGKSVAKDLDMGCSESKKNCLAEPLEDYSAIPDDTIACVFEGVSVQKQKHVVLPLTEASEKTGPVVLKCHNSNRSWERRFQQMDKKINFEIKAHYSYKAKSGELVKDATSKSLNFRDITENGFKGSDLYKTLLAEGASEISLKYILIKKNQKMRSVRDEYLNCSFDTCPLTPKKESISGKAWNYFINIKKEPAPKEAAAK